MPHGSLTLLETIQILRGYLVGTYCLSLQLLVKVLRYFCDCLVQVGYPLVTLLLCLGDPHTFKESFGAHLDLLYKLLKVSMY